VQRPAADGPGPVAPVAPSGPLVWVAPPIGDYVPSTPNTGVTLPMLPPIGAATNEALPGTPGFIQPLLSQLVPFCDAACLAASVPPLVPAPPVTVDLPQGPIRLPLG
jgi:hypothetical protein